MSLPSSRPAGGLGQRTFDGLTWMASASAIQVPLQLGVIAVLARLISPAGFGFVGASLVVIGLSQLVSQLGIREALVQQPDLGPDHIAVGNSVSLLLGVTTTCAILLAAPLFTSVFAMDQLTPLLRGLAPVVAISSLSIVSEGLLQRRFEYRSLATIQLVSYGLGYGLVGVVGAIFGWGAWALVAATVARETLRSALLIAWARPSLRMSFRVRPARDLLGYGTGLTVSLLPTFFALQADNFIVARWLGAVPLGLYGRAYNMMSLPVMLLGSALDQVLFPAMASVQDELERLATALLRAVHFLALAALPVGVVIFALAPEIVAVLLGPAWTDVVVPFRVLAVGIYFRLTYKASDSLIKAKGAVYGRAWRQSIWAALVVTGALVGRRWGVAGVATGVTLATATITALTAQLSTRLVGLSWRRYLSSQVRPLGIAVGVGLLVGTGAWAGRAITTSPLIVIAVALLPLLSSLVIVWKLEPKWILGEESEWAMGILKTQFIHRDTDSENEATDDAGQ